MITRNKMSVQVIAKELNHGPFIILDALNLSKKNGEAISSGSIIEYFRQKDNNEASFAMASIQYLTSRNLVKTRYLNTQKSSSRAILIIPKGEELMSYLDKNRELKTKLLFESSKFLIGAKDSFAVSKVEPFYLSLRSEMFKSLVPVLTNQLR